MNQETTATLHIREINKEGRSFELAYGQCIKIGRGEDNELPLDDHRASRVHAIINVTANGIILTDLGSSNGTYLNGEAVVGLRELSNNDILDIGTTKIRIELPGSLVQGDSSKQFDGETTFQLISIPATILVTSISGYSTMLEDIPAHDLSGMLNRWRSEITKTIEHYGGRIDKSVGATTIALWLGEEASKKAEMATYAAVKIRQVTEKVGQPKDWSYHNEHPWYGSVIVHSGVALKDSHRNDTQNERAAITLLGAPINTALRLEELVAKLGEDLILSESTASLIEDKFHLSKIIKVKIHGNPEGMGTFTVISAK